MLAAGAIGAVAAGSARRTPRPTTPVIGPATVDHVRVTMLDGSQLEISGPPSLGLTKLAPAFNGALGPANGQPQWGTLGHGFSVDRKPPPDLGAVVGRYPTHDGHELVVHSSTYGVTAVVQYGDWWLSATWSSSPAAQWTAFASELNAKESADGYLVIEPTDPSWKLSWADAPDMQLGGSVYGSGASFAFFGPGLYPAGLPHRERRDAHGARLAGVDGERRVVVRSQREGPRRGRGIRTWSTRRSRAYGSGTRPRTPRSIASRRSTVRRSTSPRLRRCSTSSACKPASRSTGIDTPNVLNETPNFLPVEVSRGALPAGAGEPSFPTADGHRFFSYHLPTECDCDVLAATYGEWLVEIEVERSGGTQTMSVADRTRVASLFGAHETADGFLVLDPAAPMRLGPAGAPDIVLDGVDMGTAAGQECSAPISVEAHTPEGFPVHYFGTDKATWCDPNARVSVDILSGGTRALVNQVRVRRVS